MAEKIMVASARHDENGKYVNGTDGDQLQTSSTNDTVGEVAMQEMYTHKKGWYISRLVDETQAEKLAERMITGANNKNIGYGQNDRLDVVKNGIDTTTPSNCDCGTLVRQAFKEATGVDPGNFTTANEVSKLEATGLVETHVEYVSQEKTPVYNGDILTTKTKGHTVVVVSGNPRVVKKEETSAFTLGQKVKLTKGAKFTNGKSPASWVFERVLYVRKITGEKVQISIYETGAVTGTVYAKDLVSLEETVQEVVKDTYYPKYTGKSIVLDTILKEIGVPEKYRGSYKNRKPLAEANGISNYTGAILQNSKLKSLAKNGKLLKV